MTAEEIFALCGIDHITISSAGLALLQRTPLDGHFKSIRDRSLSYDASNVDPGSPYFSADLTQSLQDPEIAALMDDALLHFGRAESELRQIAKSLM